jgi:hypothetical protein
VVVAPPSRIPLAALARRLAGRAAPFAALLLVALAGGADAAGASSPGPVAAGDLAAVAPTDVDVALILAADVSLSMDAGELRLQREGYAEALTSPEVAQAIRYGHNKRIAVAYFEWGSADKQVLVAPWTIVDGPEAAGRLADTIRTAPGNSLERTAIGAALVFAGTLFEQSPLKAERRVVDLSGDGPSNMGVSLTEAREKLIARGITINGLPIMPKPGDWPASLPPLDVYFESCVVGGLGAFSLPAESMETFAMALRTKLILEIAGLPQVEPRLMRAGYKPVDCREFD